ncbi:isoaspartyl peptidase/L-asparaginase family protein [Candidatus Chloroploca asiatica]|uniref:Peptidase T n=1 Tax=Candidatus Chloroploca asiatica TaxID=1506545 RepID=A0A2H3KTQ3_9CHLR|nr:isoaspartyl peptidase/L-asparaginase [Candidatus Chloroploca asiatica]PDW01255.1 peptidase T [Candidatus Chloroploca asiatica]
MPIAMIVHGGAWDIPDEQVEAHLHGCRVALEAGLRILRAGGTALEACEAAVRLMEDDPIFDAGTGSVLTSAGTVELDAALMDGRSLRYGAVANLKRIRNPITLARHVLEGPATFIGGEGAEHFAASCGMPFCDNAELIVEREVALWQAWKASRRQDEESTLEAQPDPAVVHGHDTVGAIALDKSGNLVAANSTGGTPFKLPGRIGDTPMVGCGLYADATIGGAVCTGWGEGIVRVALARRAIEQLERGVPPQTAAESAMHTLARYVDGGRGGCIILTPSGQIGLAWNTRRMAYAYATEDTPLIAGV